MLSDRVVTTLNGRWRGRRFRSHRVRCVDGRHGRRRQRENGSAGPDDVGRGGGRFSGRRERGPCRSARLYGHGVVGPAGTAQGPGHYGGRQRRRPQRPRSSGRVSGRAVRRVHRTVHAARRVAHVVSQGGGRLV